VQDSRAKQTPLHLGRCFVSGWVLDLCHRLFTAVWCLGGDLTTHCMCARFHGLMGTGLGDTGLQVKTWLKHVLWLQVACTCQCHAHSVRTKGRSVGNSLMFGRTYSACAWWVGLGAHPNYKLVSALPTGWGSPW